MKKTAATSGIGLAVAALALAPRDHADTASISIGDLQGQSNPQNSGQFTASSGDTPVLVRTRLVLVL